MGVWSPSQSIIQVNQLFTTAGRTGECTFWFRQTGGDITDEDTGAFVNGMLADFFDPNGSLNTMARRWVDLAAPQFTLLNAVAYVRSRNPQPVPVVIPHAATAGRRGGECLPPQSAAMFRLRTFGPAKSGQGRRYFGGFSELDQVGGSWSLDPVFQQGVAFLGQRQTANVTTTNAIGQQVTFTPIIWSRKRSEWYTLMQANWISVVRTQRRRAGRLGPTWGPA